MKIYYVLPFIFILGVIACTNENNEPVATAPGQRVEFTPDELPITQIFSRADSSFEAEGFAETNKTTIESSESTLIKETDVKDFLPVLFYSPDSNYAIDPYSYNYIFRKGKSPTVAFDEAGPDMEVGLLNFKDSSRRRLWFAGPSVTLLKADWINNKEIAIAGAELLPDNKGLPFILVINVETGEVTNFQNGDTLDYVDRNILKDELEQRWTNSRSSKRIM